MELLRRSNFGPVIFLAQQWVGPQSVVLDFSDDRGHLVDFGGQQLLHQARSVVRLVLLLHVVANGQADRRRCQQDKHRGGRKKRDPLVAPNPLDSPLQWTDGPHRNNLTEQKTLEEILGQSCRVLV